MTTGVITSLPMASTRHHQPRCTRSLLAADLFDHHFAELAVFATGCHNGCHDDPPPADGRETLPRESMAEAVEPAVDGEVVAAWVVGGLCLVDGCHERFADLVGPFG
jgi:hypothetical protein